MPRVFISYRRADCSHVAGRLFDKLVARYGARNVFKDVYRIAAGSDFREMILNAVSSSDVLLAIVGENWASARGNSRTPRLFESKDLVRLEIITALNSGVRILPVVVDGSKMPDAEDLPSDMQGFASRNAISIRADPDFHRDVDRLIDSIEMTSDNSLLSYPSSQDKAVNLNPQIESRFFMKAVSGPLTGQSFPLRRAGLTIRRVKSCDIWLKDEPYISRTHCRLDWDHEKKIYILNAWTVSGVNINDQWVQGPVELASGDRIRIGATELRFERAYKTL